jgi:hypothetical protein
MPYNQELDVKLFSKSIETESDRLTVSIFSYNNGPKKLQISRENKNTEGGYKFAKMGRLTQEEAEATLPLIQEAITNM